MKKALLTLLSVALAGIAGSANAQEATTRLEVGIEATSSQKMIEPDIAVWNTGDQVRINGENYLVFAEEGKLYVAPKVSSNGTYIGSYPADCSGLDRTEDNHIKLVPAQHYKANGVNKVYMPLYASTNAGGKLTFKPMCGIVSITLSGSASINTIKVEDNTGVYLAGYCNRDSLTNKVIARKSTAAGVYFTVLDCSNKGVGVELHEQGTMFNIVLPAREYPQGLKVTVTDRSNHSMIYNTKPFVLNDVVILPSVAYKPAENQIFAEHFDAMVYGGNRVAGKGNRGYGPMRKHGEVNEMFDGTERAYHLYEFDKPGTTYFQEGHEKGFLQDHAMSMAYIINRNIQNWQKMFRVQEYQGYVGVGVRNNTRGIITSPQLTSLDGINEIEITFKVCPQEKLNSNIEFCTNKAGVVKELWINGIRRELDRAIYPYGSSETEYILLRPGRDILPTSKTSEEKKQWSEIRAVISGATSETSFTWSTDQFSSKYVNGFFLDDIEVKHISTVKRENTLRIMTYNVQNGMWGDSGNNYDNFVAWMQSQDPDICIFCESQSSYKPGSHERLDITERYLPYKTGHEWTKGVDPNLEPDGWIELASRWGHTYGKIGAHIDNHPVVVTSKYPITLVQKLGAECPDKIWHGGIHAQVTVNGERINIVGYHTWPFGYGRDVEKADRLKSTYAFGGDLYREYETEYFMNSTILNPAYAQEKLWIITGDTNCRSPLDDTHLEYGIGSPRYGSNQCVLNTGVHDLVKEYYSPDRRDVHVRTTQGGARIDIMYGSDEMANRVIRAESPRAGFTWAPYNKEARFYDKSSDHLPVIVDFKWK